MNEERRALWQLIYQGYSPKKLLKMLTIINKEIKEDINLEQVVKYYINKGN